MGTEGTERVQHHHHTSHPTVSVHADPLLAYLPLITCPPLFPNETLVSRAFFPRKKPLIFPPSTAISLLFPNPYSPEITRRVYLLLHFPNSFIFLSPLNDWVSSTHPHETRRTNIQSTNESELLLLSFPSVSIGTRSCGMVDAAHTSGPLSIPSPTTVGVIGIGNKMLRFTSYREVYWAGKIGGPKKECPI